MRFRAGSCVVCGQGTDTAVAFVGEAEWCIAGLIVLGVPADDAEPTFARGMGLEPGMVPGGDLVMLDDDDARMLADRQAALERVPGVRVGDLVTFADGARRRIARVWDDGAQPTDWRAGSFYLGAGGYLQHSGGLDPAVLLADLTPDGEGEASAWFFHHDVWRAGGAVAVRVRVRCWRCALPAPGVTS